MIVASADNSVECPLGRGNTWLSPGEIIEAHSRGRGLRQGEIERFVQRGISLEFLFSPYPVLGAEVVFLTNGYFEFSDDYYDDTSFDHAFIILVEGCSGVIDIAAWEPKSGRLALWLNRAVALGEEQIWLPRIHDYPLRIWRTPMKWLAASREGLVIVRREAAFHSVGTLSSVVAEDVDHGIELETLLTPPKPRTRILVPASTDSIVGNDIDHCEAA